MMSKSDPFLFAFGCNYCILIIGGRMAKGNTNTTGKTIEIIPAVLVQSHEELISKIEVVKPYVTTVQIDIMDNVFVPNKTIGIENLNDLPKGINYEFHWMVEEPEKWISKIDPDNRTNDLHLIHVESLMNFEKVKNAVKKVSGKLGIAFNPETSLDQLTDFEDEVDYILAMTVHPGFSGQKYIAGVESKVKQLRKNHPDYDIEVDGGITVETIKGAVLAGANKIVAASAIYAQPNIPKAIIQLETIAKGIHYV